MDSDQHCLTWQLCQEPGQPRLSPAGPDFLSGLGYQSLTTPAVPTFLHGYVCLKQFFQCLAWAVPSCLVLGGWLVLCFSSLVPVYCLFFFGLWVLLAGFCLLFHGFCLLTSCSFWISFAPNCLASSLLFSFAPTPSYAWLQLKPLSSNSWLLVVA